MTIEKLQPGDRVLSQDSDSGELRLQTVQDVTLRPATALLSLDVGSETIRVTRGHPFWVNGQGWRMAKHLSTGDTLHSLGGPVKIDHVAEAPAAEAYNLVVSSFGTYLVGEHRLMVHDNLPLAETTTLVPGLEARAVK